MNRIESAINLFLIRDIEKVLSDEVDFDDITDYVAEQYDVDVSELLKNVNVIVSEALYSELKLIGSEEEKLAAVAIVFFLIGINYEQIRSDLRE